jgi:hypothetical protein
LIFFQGQFVFPDAADDPPNLRSSRLPAMQKVIPSQCPLFPRTTPDDSSLQASLSLSKLLSHALPQFLIGFNGSCQSLSIEEQPQMKRIIDSRPLAF